MIDYERAVCEFADRIFHVHAKDLEIRRDGLYEHGVMPVGTGWQMPRLSGPGEVRWRRYTAPLYAVGYGGAVTVEHEDSNVEGTREFVGRGFDLVRDALQPYIV